MFLALPLIFAANPLQTYGFSYGRERLVVARDARRHLRRNGGDPDRVRRSPASRARRLGFLLRQGLMFAAIAAIAASAAPPPPGVPALPLTSVEAPVP